MTGAWKIGKVYGAPVYVHWSLLFLGPIVSGWPLRAGVIVGALLVVFLHELGHALMVRRYRLRVREVALHGLGGHCAWSGDASPVALSWIAAGGVLMQLVVAAIAYALLVFVPALAASSRIVADMLDTFVGWNLVIAGLNLLPIPPLDGVEVWKLPRRLREARRRRRSKSIAKAVRQSRELASIGEVDDAEVKKLVQKALAKARESEKS